MKKIYVCPEMDCYTEINEDVISTSGPEVFDPSNTANEKNGVLDMESKNINFADDIDW